MNSEFLFIVFFGILAMFVAGSIYPIEAVTKTYESDDTVDGKTKTIEQGDILQIKPGANVLFINTIQNFGIIQNHGTMTIVGTLNNQAAGGVNNNNGGTIEIIEPGTINVFLGSVISNFGEINNKGSINVYVGGLFTNNEGAFFSNENTITNVEGIILNVGTIENKFGAEFTNSAETIINKGTILNSGKIINKKIFSNNYEGTITINPEGSLTNTGVISNFGVISSIASLITTTEGTIMNEGSIYSCDGVIEGKSNVEFNSILFDCENREEEIEQRPPSQNSDDDSASSSQKNCVPGMILQDGKCVEEIIDSNGIKGGIPDWIKNNVVMWANGNVADSDFLDGIRSLVNDGIIDITDFGFAEKSQSEFVPEWFTITTGWWSEGLISEGEFINAVKFLVEKNIIRI